MIGLPAPEVNFRAHEIDEQRAGDYDADATFDRVSRENVDHVSEDLGRDYCDRQSPSPYPAQEPARCSDGER